MFSQYKSLIYVAHLIVKAAATTPSFTAFITGAANNVRSIKLRPICARKKAARIRPITRSTCLCCPSSATKRNATRRCEMPSCKLDEKSTAAVVRRANRLPLKKKTSYIKCCRTKMIFNCLRLFFNELYLVQIYFLNLLRMKE